VAAARILLGPGWSSSPDSELVNTICLYFSAIVADPKWESDKVHCQCYMLIVSMPSVGAKEVKASGTNLGYCRLLSIMLNTGKAICNERSSIRQMPAQNAEQAAAVYAARGPHRDVRQDRQRRQRVELSGRHGVEAHAERAQRRRLAQQRHGDGRHTRRDPRPQAQRELLQVVTSVLETSSPWVLHVVRTEHGCQCQSVCWHVRAGRWRMQSPQPCSWALRAPCAHLDAAGPQAEGEEVVCARPVHEL